MEQKTIIVRNKKNRILNSGSNCIDTADFIRKWYVKQYGLSKMTDHIGYMLNVAHDEIGLPDLIYYNTRLQRIVVQKQQVVNPRPLSEGFLTVELV